MIMIDAGSPRSDWAWPEYTRQEGELDPANVQIKKDIVAEYGKEAIYQSWIKVCNNLAKSTQEMISSGNNTIPEVSYDEFFALSDAQRSDFKDRGCIVVRGAVPEETATGWFHDIKTYMKDNKGTITGWPRDEPYILQLYWSRPQLGCRTHPRTMAIQRAILDLFHDDEDPDKNFATPLAYADAMRIRPPGKRFHGLGPHIDAGSLCRWGDPEYRRIYSNIWSGRPEHFDPYDFKHRKRGNPSYYPGAAQSHVVRAFQGWTALSPAAPGEGSLQLFPDLKNGIAYVLLRPFFKPPESPDEVMDPKKWHLDVEDPWFPGVWRHTPQVLSPDAFPHLRLKETLPHIPPMCPGDTVWWHMDMCHAVEIEHNGTDDACVVYSAATPTCDANVAYMKGQLQDFLNGVSPEDFRGGCYEKGLVGFPGGSAILNGDEGRRACGFYL